MEDSSLPLRKEIVEMINRNRELLVNDLRQHLESNDKLSHFPVSDIYPQLYFSLIKEIIEQFDMFNKDGKYTQEINSSLYSDEERMHYYDCLLFDTASSLMTFK